MTQEFFDRTDLEFVLYDVLQTEQLCGLSRYAEHSRETFCAALDLAEQIAREKFLPIYRQVDEHEPEFKDGKVTLLPEVKDAVGAFAAAGFLAATHEAENGGLDLPVTITQACLAMFRAANVAISGYCFLTSANANLIRAYGTDSQKSRYLPKLLAGQWFGTMAITEPHAGSSVPDLRTTATPRGDGTYSISGSKIFISAGDHDLGENIVHLVLARLPDAPAGAKGLSLFLVPKYRVGELGQLGQNNNVVLAGLIHKMGYRGTTSTILQFGDNDASCVGELIGPPNGGLACMFHMMNEARIGVGMGSTMLGYRSYVHAREYARERRQGRHPDSKTPGTPQVPIIEHADVRRMLLTQKCYVEGALTLALYAARLADIARASPNQDDVHEASHLLGILTPVVKSWPSQFCLEANSLAIQIHGGYGYTRDYPVEQLYRDNRLNPLHEGTHGIQGIDLVARKIGTPGFELLVSKVEESIKAAHAMKSPELATLAQELQRAWDEVRITSSTLRARHEHAPRQALELASVFLEVFGHAVVGWMWLQQAMTVVRLAPSATSRSYFHEGKLAAARWFFRTELPKAGPQHALLRETGEGLLDLAETAF